MTSAADVWEKIKELLREDLSDVTIETWFGTARAVALEGSRFLLCIPEEFKLDVVSSRYLPPLRRAFQTLFSFDMDVKLLTPAEREAYLAQKSAPSKAHRLEERYTFERFVVGSTNKFAFTAAKKVAEEPGGAYNPLFIYGQSGLGKTHLLHAIAHRVRQDSPGARIVYVESEDFVNEYITNIRRGLDMQQFRDKYRGVDLFLMDDVQFISGKDACEEELFHTFNTLHEQKKQIVFTADRPPQELIRISQRLRTRFEQGLPADIQPPDYETRKALLMNKSLERGVDLPDAVLSYMAENLTSNVRQIEGVVNKLMAFQEIMGQKIDMDATIRAVRDILKSKEDFLPSPDLIIQETARFYELDPAAIRGQGQNKELSTARNMAMYIIREMTQLSLAEIGAQFGGRHPSTVLNSINRVEKLLKENGETMEVIRDITNAVNAAY